MIKSILKSGLGTAVGNAVSTPFNLLSMGVQSMINKNLMEHQQKLNLDSFQHQVASTSIGAQIKRLKANGLNPALALGSGVGSMSGQVGSTSLSGVSPSSPYVMSPAEVSQVDNINANTNKTNEETIRLKTENLHFEDKLIAELNNLKAEYLEKLSKKDLNESQRKHYEKSIESIDQDIAESRKRIEKIDAEITELGTRSSLNTAKATESGTQSKLNEATTDKVKEEGRQLKENADVIREGLVANVNLSDSQREYYLWLATKHEFEGNLIQKELENYDINLYARLAQMTSQELRGWFQAITDYKEMLNKADNDDKKDANFKRFLILRYILPLLLKK